MTKSDSWFPLAVYLGVFLAGVCVACFNVVGLPLATMGSVGFIVLYIWDKIYTNRSLAEDEEFDNLERKVLVLDHYRETTENQYIAECATLARRLDDLEAKSKSIQTTVSFLKGK